MASLTTLVKLCSEWGLNYADCFGEYQSPINLSPAHELLAEVLCKLAWGGAGRGGGGEEGRTDVLHVIQLCITVLLIGWPF